MSDSRHPKPARCGNCGFDFECALASSTAASAVVFCPACGVESPVNHCLFSSCSETALRSDGTLTKFLGRKLFQIDAPQDEHLRCRSQNCPRLNGSSCCSKKSFHEKEEKAGQAASESGRPRRVVVLSTVLLQLLVLAIAVGLLFHYQIARTSQPAAANRLAKTPRPAGPLDTPLTPPPFSTPQRVSAPTTEEKKTPTVVPTLPASKPPTSSETKTAETQKPTPTPEQKSKQPATSKPDPFLAKSFAKSVEKSVAKTPPAIKALPAPPAAKVLVSEKPKQIPNRATTPPIRLLEDAPRYEQAQTRMAQAENMLVENPARCLEEILSVLKLFQEIDRPAPPATYWLLGQAYAALSWGQMLAADSPRIEEMALNPDGRQILLQFQDNTVQLLPVICNKNALQSTGPEYDTQEHSLPGRYVKCRFSPERRLLIGGREDGRICVWDVSKIRSSESPLLLRETVPGLKDLIISPDGRWLAAYGNPASGEADIMAHIANAVFWEQNDEQQISIQKVNYTSTRQSLSSAGIVSHPTSTTANSVATTIWLWDLQRLSEGTLPSATILTDQAAPEQATEPKTAPKTGPVIHALAFSDQAAKLAVACSDGTTRVYSLSDKNPSQGMTVLRGHRLDVTALAFGPGGRWLATGSRDNTIRLWLFIGAAQPESFVLRGHIGWISSLATNAAGDRLYSGSYDKTIRIWEIPTRLSGAVLSQPPRVLQNNQGVIREMVLSQDGTKLISRGGDGSLRIKNLDGVHDDKHSILFRNRRLPINGLALMPDGRGLVFSYINRREPAKSGVRYWPLQLDSLATCIRD